MTHLGTIKMMVEQTQELAYYGWKTLEGGSRCQPVFPLLSREYWDHTGIHGGKRNVW